MEAILSGLQIILAVIVIVLILLHSGKDAGLSGAFGVGTGAKRPGRRCGERNLNRWTVFFAACSSERIVLLKSSAGPASPPAAPPRRPPAQGT